MSAKRRAITERMKVDALLCIALWNDAPGIKCAMCDDILSPRDEIDWDHHPPLSRGGTHDYRGIRPLHRECHKRKTFHPRSLATTLCGDNYEAKKTDRLEQKVAGTWQLGKPKRKLPKGRPIPSRPFEKRKRA